MHSDFLYARPSFVEGLARIMDFGSTLNEYNTSLADEEADFTAIYVDWYRIGQDLHDAFGKFEIENADKVAFISSQPATIGPEGCLSD